MRAHARAIQASRTMCDRLFARLGEQIPGLEREFTQQWCAIYEPGRNRFAYVQHRLTDDVIEVWCSGEVGRLRACKGIEVRPRSRIRDKGWEKQFPARFEVYNDETLAAGTQCLLAVSYPAS